MGISKSGVDQIMNVVVIGAHTEPSKYSNKAMIKLAEHGHECIPVNPKFSTVLNKTCYKSLTELKSSQPSLKIDTITLYVNPAISDQLKDEIVLAKPKRVIFNPGSENHHLINELKKYKIECVEGCTLVMLQIGTF